MSRTDVGNIDNLRDIGDKINCSDTDLFRQNRRPISCPPVCPLTILHYCNTMYDVHIPVADERFRRHLERLKQEEEGG